MRLIDADDLKKNIGIGGLLIAYRDRGEVKQIKEVIDRQPTAYDVEYELRLLKNYINEMPKVYRKRNMNWCIVKDLLMQGTSTSGRTSCITKCYELGTDPWGYELKGAVKDE